MKIKQDYAHRAGKFNDPVSAGDRWANWIIGAVAVACFAYGAWRWLGGQ